MNIKIKNIIISITLLSVLIIGTYALKHLSKNNIPEVDALEINKKTTLIDFKEHNIITHAMGEINGHTYTNSKEAFLYNYKKGARVFEVDLIETLDGHLVARHDWYNKLYKTLNQDYIPNEENKPLTYEQFKNLKIHKNLTPIDFEDILDLMSQYEDIYIVTDTKSGYSEDAKRAFGKMIKLINEKNPELIKRIVPQIYSQAMYPTMKELYDFENILYTLYMDLSTDEEVLKFVLENDISGVVMSETRYSENLVESLNENNIKTYIHTINDADTANDYIEKGFYGIYTDYPEIKENLIDNK